MDKMVSVLIVEDLPEVKKSLRKGLSELGYRISGIAGNAQDAFHILDKKNTDIVLVSSSLKRGGADGISIGERIGRQYKLPFVFITSLEHQKNVISFINANPSSYLVKPFAKLDIYAAIEFARKNFIQLNLRKLDKVKNGTLHIGDQIFIKEKQIYNKIALSDILYFRSELKYIQIHLKSLKKYTIRRNLTDVLSLLPSTDFIQTHRSFVINKNAVDYVGYNYVIINGEEIPVSSSRKQDLINMFHFL